MPSINRKKKYALWLRSTEWEFVADELKELIAAFAPLKGVVWSAIAHLDVPDKENEAKSWADDWNLLTDETILQSSMNFEPRKKTVTYKIGSLSSDAYKILPDVLMSGSGFGISEPEQGCIISFIPKSHPVKEAYWARIVQGPAWLWLCSEWLANSPEPSLQSNAVLVSYIDLTNDMGGVASLVWSDCDCRMGLTFFGSEAILGPVAARLEANPSFISDKAVFEQLFARGFSYILSP
ncbi:MAG: hypothetical protein ABFD64_09295 [Armatimonadota bacterium]